MKDVANHSLHPTTHAIDVPLWPAYHPTCGGG
jgi:hypothetical protein